MLALIKLYLISVIQGSLTVYNIGFSESQIFLKMSFMIGLVIFGNIIDNISHPKWVAIFL